MMIEMRPIGFVSRTLPNEDDRDRSFVVGGAYQTRGKRAMGEAGAQPLVGTDLAILSGCEAG